MVSYCLLAEKIQSLRRKKNGFITNAFFNANQLQKMVGEEGISIFSSEDTILILSEEPGLIRLYFYAVSLDALKQIPQILPSQTNKSIVTDIVGKEKQVDMIVGRLCELGFFKHNELFRMVRKPEEICEEVSPDVLFATPNRCDEIYKMIYATFDVYSEHLPTKDKILQSVEKNEILMILHQDRIIGLFYFEKPGDCLVYVYLVAVAEEFRGMGIADKLEKHPLITYGKDHVFNLWVVKSNQKAIKKHLKYNFEPDGLVDAVLIYKGV
jgi:predicted GNAT family acetyltransferase